MRSLRSLLSWVVVIVVAVLASILIRSFLFTTFYVPSASMEPTLIGREGGRQDRIVVNRLSYRLHDVHRGDIVVFHAPKGLEPRTPDGRPIKELVKRVVGLPGETVSLQGGRVLVDGKALDESYLPDDTRTVPPIGPDCGPTRWVIPDDEVLMMGDNRGNSIDGRCFGPVEESAIVGRAFVRVWPLSAIGGL